MWSRGLLPSRKHNKQKDTIWHLYLFVFSHVLSVSPVFYCFSCFLGFLFCPEVIQPQFVSHHFWMSFHFQVQVSQFDSNPRHFMFSQNFHLFWVFSCSSSVAIVAKKLLPPCKFVRGIAHTSRKCEPKISKQLKHITTIATNYTCQSSCVW